MHVEIGKMNSKLVKTYDIFRANIHEQKALLLLLVHLVATTRR